LPLGGQMHSLLGSPAFAETRVTERSIDRHTGRDCDH
jgi:hypothetical protein